MRSEKCFQCKNNYVLHDPLSRGNPVCSSCKKKNAEKIAAGIKKNQELMKKKRKFDLISEKYK